MFTASICTVAFIDVCGQQLHHCFGTFATMYLQIFQALTTAVHSISVQLVPCDTAADEAPNSVSTSVLRFLHELPTIALSLLDYLCCCT